SRLDVFGNSLKHAQDNGVGSVLDHLFAQLGDNSGLAQFGVRQSFRIDLGVNGLDLGNQLGAGRDQGVNVDLGSFLGVSEFGLQLADFFVFGLNGGLVSSLSVSQGLYR